MSIRYIATKNCRSNVLKWEAGEINSFHWLLSAFSPQWLFFSSFCIQCENFWVFSSLWQLIIRKVNNGKCESHIECMRWAYAHQTWSDRWCIQMAPGVLINLENWITSLRQRPTSLWVLSNLSGFGSLLPIIIFRLWKDFNYFSININLIK